MLKIDLGGGTAPARGYLNIDHVHGEGPLLVRLGEMRLPFTDGRVDAARASHVLEHIPAGAPRLQIMNEVHRVLAPWGTFQIIVPLFPSWQAIADPTHVSLWVMESFDYFDGSMSANADYGHGMWETLDWTVYHGWEGHWLGRPIKDSSLCECERWRDGITICPVHGTVKGDDHE